MQSISVIETDGSSVVAVRRGDLDLKMHSHWRRHLRRTGEDTAKYRECYMSFKNTDFTTSTKCKSLS
jgi:hypothetical protein